MRSGRRGTARLNPHCCTGWPEDDVLTRLRYRILEQDGAIGRRASKFSEGGYCTLFREGMAIAGRGGNDALIAAACARVYEDEFEHMLEGIVGLEDAAMADEDWARMETLVVRLLAARVRMRNGQFSHPLGPERIAEIEAGRIAPIAFDYAKAEALLNH